MEIIVVKCWIRSPGALKIIDRLMRTDSWTAPRGNRTWRLTEPSELLTGRGLMLKCPTHELALVSELLVLTGPVWQVGDDTDGARADHRAVRRGQHPPCASFRPRDRGAAPRAADLHSVRRWTSDIVRKVVNREYYRWQELATSFMKWCCWSMTLPKLKLNKWSKNMDEQPLTSLIQGLN